MNKTGHRIPEFKRKVTQNIFENLNTDYSLNENGLMLYKNILYVPNIPEIKLLILNEVHKSTQKMITMF